MALDAIRKARELLAGNDAAAANRALGSALGAGPDPLASPDALAAALGLLAELAGAFGDASLAGKLGASAARPDDPRALYDAAYDLFEQHQFAAASALLYRANAIAPGVPQIVAELAASLEHQLRYGEAALVVDASGLAASEPICAYLSGFHWMMVGDVERARAGLARLAGLETPSDARIGFVRDALAGMIARADALRAAGIALDDGALTPWQAVIDGTALLHESPHGYPDPMRGRYAFVGDSAGLQREGLERLRALLDACNARPPAIVSAPDRASRILGRAASALFGVPLEERTPGDARPALVVAWSMEDVGDEAFLRAMHDQRPGQTLFVHASSWTEPFAYAPDVTTLLHQSVTSPWTGGAFKIDPETRQMTRTAPDPRTDDAIAREILEAEISDASVSVSSVASIVAVVRALDAVAPEHRLGLRRDGGERRHQRAGSPVSSARFT